MPLQENHKADNVFIFCTWHKYVNKSFFALLKWSCIYTLTEPVEFWQCFCNFTKGNLISESFSPWLKSPKKEGAKSLLETFMSWKFYKCTHSNVWYSPTTLAQDLEFYYCRSCRKAVLTWTCSMMKRKFVLMAFPSEQF